MTTPTKDPKTIKKTRPVFKCVLETPFQINTWPETSGTDQVSIFEILKLFFETEFGKEDTQSKLAADQKKSRPIIIGFNNVTQALELQSQRNRYTKAGAPFTDTNDVSNKPSEEKQDQDDSEIALVIVCRQDIGSELAVSHFPTLCASASVPRLVEVPKGSTYALTKIYNDTKSDSSKETTKPSSQNTNSKNNKPTTKSRNVEITVIALTRSSFSKFPLLQSLYTLIEDRNIGYIQPQALGFKKVNIATLKTVAPIVNKKQDAKKQKIENGSKPKK